MALAAADRGPHRGRFLAVHDRRGPVDAGDGSGNFEQFGSFGIALSFVTFFTGMAFAIVIGAVLGPVLSEAANPFGRWLRSGTGSTLETGAPPALPGPSRPMRLSDAIGRGANGSGVAPSDPTRSAEE